MLSFESKPRKQMYKEKTINCTLSYMHAIALIAMY